MLRLSPFRSGLVLALALGLQGAFGGGSVAFATCDMSFLNAILVSPPGAGPTDPITITLNGRMPFASGSLADARVVSPTRLEFTLREEQVGDTNRTWSHDFEIGTLPAGQHVVAIQATLQYRAGGSESCSTSFVLDVSDPNNPPDPPSFLIRGLSGWTTSPAQPNDTEPTTLVLWGWFPYDCGIAATAPASPPDTATIPAIDVGLTLQPGTPPCPGDSGRMWRLEYPLGILEAGSHAVRVHMTAYGDPATPSPDFRLASFWGLDVSHGPPPPPPTEPPSFVVRGLSGWSTIPAEPTEQQPTTLVLRGWFPYPCGAATVVPASRPDTATVKAFDVGLELRPGEPCSDTASTWTLSFPLGLLAAGSYGVRVHLTAYGDSVGPSPDARLGTFYGLDVRPGSVPIALPVDSLLDTRPNPFTIETRFGVKLERSAVVEVGVYDLQGRRVRAIYRGMMEPGTWLLQWDGRRDDGSIATPGMYFCRMMRPGFARSRRVVFLPRP